MARKFELTEPAKNDLLEIWSHKEKFQLLADNPKIGKLQDDLIVNLRRFLSKDYLIFYFPTEDGVEIYRVFHGARNVADLFEDYFEGLKP